MTLVKSHIVRPSLEAGTDERISIIIRQSHRLVMAAMLALFAFAIYMIPSQSREGIDAGGDTGAAEILPIAILHYHALDFNAFLKDYQLPDTDAGQSLPYYLSRTNGRVVSFYPIVPGVLNVPVYWIADRFGIDLFAHRYQLSAITSAAVTALSVGAMFLTLGFVCSLERDAIFFGLLYAFATTAWSVCSRTLWQHGPAMLFLTSALAMILSGDRRWIARGGFVLAMAVWTRPSAALIAIPIGLYVAAHRRDKLVPLIMWAMVPIASMAVYSHIYCGSILNLGQGRSFVQDTTGPHSTYGAGWIGLAGLLFSPARGLFVFTPIFIFGFGFLFNAFREVNRQSAYPYLAGAVLIYIAFYSQWKVWWGGYCFGYRLLSEIAPILIIFSAEAWQRWVVLRHWRIGIFLAFAAISLCFNFLGAFYYPTNFNNVPQSVNTRPYRLWNVADTELIRCLKSAKQ